jgi:hypothetical protein
MKNLEKIYRMNKANMEKEYLEPGTYEVKDYDQDGRYVIGGVTFELLDRMNKWEIAQMLYEKRGYWSPWGWLNIYKLAPKVDVVLG